MRAIRYHGPKQPLRRAPGEVRIRVRRRVRRVRHGAGAQIWCACPTTSPTMLRRPSVAGDDRGARRGARAARRGKVATVVDRTLPLEQFQDGLDALARSELSGARAAALSDFSPEGRSP